MIAREDALSCNVLGGGERGLRLEGKVEASLIVDNVRAVDLNLESTAGLRVALVVQSEVQLQAILIGDGQDLFDGQIVRVVRVDDCKLAPLESCLQSARCA